LELESILAKELGLHIANEDNIGVEYRMYSGNDSLQDFQRANRINLNPDESSNLLNITDGSIHPKHGAFLSHGGYPQFEFDHFSIQTYGIYDLGIIHLKKPSDFAVNERTKGYGCTRVLTYTMEKGYNYFFGANK
jgi:hypothetical protein